jgi:hypothetical protein
VDQNDAIVLVKIVIIEKETTKSAISVFFFPENVKKRKKN